MSGKLRRLWRQRIAMPLLELLRQGLEPDQLARGLACGLTLGILPLPWGITPLCALVAWRWRLNQVAVQIGNFLAWPLQLGLFIPFFRFGDFLFPFGPGFSPAGLTFEAFFSQPADLLGGLLVASLKAVIAWVLTSWLFYGMFLGTARPFFSRWGARSRRSSGQNPSDMV